MSIGRTLRAAREQAGLRQADVGRAVYLSDKAISAYEVGRRQVPRALAPAISKRLDNGRLALALAWDATGGMSSPVLDGPAVDLHRVTIRDRVLEELLEAVQALEGARVILRARSVADLDPAAVQQVDDCLTQMVEAETALSNGIPVLCQVYGRSCAGLYRRHRQELEAKGYVAKEKAPCKRR